MKELLKVDALRKSFPIQQGLFKTVGYVDAVRDVSFVMTSKETTAVVGESGSGKSTLGKMIQGLIPQTSGQIFFEGKNANTLHRSKRAQWVQTIFQDPFASLNPKLSVGTMLREAVQHSSRLVWSNTVDGEITHLLNSVGLPTNILGDYPHQFSGGQRQRLGIARALAMKPKLIVADEPVSALDLSIQAQILNLLQDIKDQFGVSYLFISHDLSVIRHIADRVLVMKDGRIVESGETKKIFNFPTDSYSRSLLEAVLNLD